MNKKKVFFLLVIGSLLFTFIQADEAAVQYEELLHYRIQHDRLYEKLQLESRIATCQAEKTKAKAIAAVEVGSGDSTITLSGGPNRLSVSAAPYANVQLPSYNNTGIRLSVPYTRSTQPLGTQGTNVDSYTIQQQFGAGLMVSTDIYSKNAAAQQLIRDQADYTATQAAQKAQEGIVHAEKRFLTDIQHIFDTYTTLLDKELQEIQAEIQFKQAELQGYAEASTKMRTIKLALMNAKREKKAAQFAFLSEFQFFTESCGKTIPEKKARPFLTALAHAVPSQELVDIAQFHASAYKELVEAEHTAIHNSIKRAIDLTPFSLSAETGYRFNTKTGKKEAALQNHNEHTLSAGLHMQFPGGKIYTGVDTPLSNPSASSIKIGISWNPFFLQHRKLALEQAELEQTIEQHHIEEAKQTYRRQLQTNTINGSSIAWQQKITADELSIYRQNAEDHAEWYKKGLITKLDYLQAGLEYKKAIMRNAKAKTAVIIFNIETKLLFE